MPPLNGRESRKLVKEKNKIPGAKSLHRGIHFTYNQRAVDEYHRNPNAKRQDHTELLVHHQKINEELKEVYARTAALHKDDMTMEERIEQSWKDFERIGGVRPPTKVKYAQHLSKLSTEKKGERGRADEERATSGDIVDYGKGSALHNAKDRRIKAFQKRQLKRAHLLKRFGDPTPLKQSGKFDTENGTLNVFKKTLRRVKRDVAQDNRVSTVKERRGGGRSMWDLRGGEENINRPSRQLVKDTREFDIGSSRPSKKRRHEY